MEMNLPVTYAPHPIRQGVHHLSVLCESGRTIREHLITAGVDLHREVVIYHNDRLLTVSEWDVVCPRPGDLLNVEAVVSGGDGSNPIATILSIAVMVFAPYMTTALVGINGAAALGSIGVGLVTTAIAIGGNLLISSLFRPSQASSASNSIANESPTYSLSGGSNRIRPYEPLPVVMGNHRIFPDYGAKPYTEFEGEDQYLYQVFNFGLGDLALSDLRIGETLLSTYSGVTVTRAENGVLPGFWGNVDTTEGASLTNALGWVVRTSGQDTTRLALDLVGAFYYANDEGGINARSAEFQMEYCATGTANWQPFIPDGVTVVTDYWSMGYWMREYSDPSYDANGDYIPGEVIGSTWRQIDYDENTSPSAHTDGDPVSGLSFEGMVYEMLYPGEEIVWRWTPVGTDPHPNGGYNGFTNSITLSGASTKPQRRTVARSVSAGQYDVRVRRLSADETDSRASSSVEWTVMRSYQEGAADYSHQTVLGIKIKASGQLNGALQQLSAHAVQNTWAWVGGSWVWTATTNPAWWYLALARGFRNPAGQLLYGGGLADEQIDLDALKAWATFCEVNALSFSAVFDQAQTLADALQTVTRCGFASPSWASGKLGVVWDAPNQTPVMAFGMANICQGSFSVEYITDNLADEVVVNYTDRNKNWESNQVRVTAPGTIGSPVKPVTVDLMGCTTNAMAAKFANALAAQQTYRRRNITWEADFEGFVCQRGDVVILSHDLTQWGYSGRLMSVSGNTVTLNKSVPRSGATEYLMVQSPDGDTEVFALTAGTGEADTLTLPYAPELQSGYAAMEHKWYFSPLPTPGKKVKITAVQPVSTSRVRIMATDEYPEYYAAWNGAFTAPTKQTLLQQNGVSLSHLTLSVKPFVVSNYQINRVTIAWRQHGEIESCTLTAWIDGQLINTWTGIKTASHVIDLDQTTGTLDVEVTPIGAAGPGAALTGSTEISTLPAPTAPLLTVTGALFAVNAEWTFGDSRKDIRATEIWFASTNNRGGAVRLTAQPFPATKFEHIGLQPGAGGYYWSRVIDTRGNASAWYPDSSTGGLPCTASTDPSLLLDQLQDAIGEDQLAAELATPISLITAADTVSGSVNARIKESNDALQAQINELSNTPAYDNATAYAVDDIVQYSGGLYKAIQATTGNLPTNTTYWTKIGDYTSLADAVADHGAKIDAINTVSAGSTSAAAQAIAGLQSSVTSLNGTVSTQATQISNRYTKAETDSAISSSSTTLTAAYQAADTSTLNSAKGYSDAAVLSEQNARASADSAMASSLSALIAEYGRANYEKPLSLWTLNGQTLQVIADGKVGNDTLRLSGAGGFPNQGNYVPIDPTKKYKTSFWARPSSNCAGRLYFCLRQFLNNSGSPGPVNGGRSPYKPGDITKEGHAATYGTGAWGFYTTVWEAADWQAGVKYVQPEFLDNYPDAAGYWDIQDFRFEEVTDVLQVTAALQTEQTTRANADSALATRATNLESSVNNPSTGLATKASVGYVDQAKADAISASAYTTSLVSARLDSGDYAAVKTSASTSTSKITGLEAKYVLQVDANGKVSGMMLASGAGGTSFTILADKFLVYKPDGSGTPKQVFSIGTVNGVSALGFDGSAIFDGSVVARSINTNGLQIRDNAGNVILGAGNLLPTSYLKAGFSGNMFPNSDLSAGIARWIVGWVQGGGTNYSAPVLDLAGIDWNPAGGHSVGVYRPGTTGPAGGYFDLSYDKNFPVVGGYSYEISAYLAAHRNEAAIVVGEYKLVNGVLTFITEHSYYTSGSPSGGQSLSNWQRCGGIFATAADCTCVRVWLRCTPAAGENPYVWCTRIFLGVCHAGQSELSPWSLGGSSGAFSELDQINAANISTYIASAAIQSAHIATAAIQTAHIGQAQIDTLRVAGNAVTVSTATSYANANTTKASLYLNFAYVPYGTVIFFTAEAVIWGSGGENPTAPVMYVTVKRNGTTVQSFEYGTANEPYFKVNGFALDSPPAGESTYTLEVNSTTYASGKFHVQGALR